MNFIAAYKKVTHLVALGIVGAYAFSQTPAGQALIQQYPKLTGVVTALGLLVALYHKSAQEK